MFYTLKDNEVNNIVSNEPRLNSVHSFSEQQVLFTKQMCAVTAEEYSEATLEVEVSVDSEEVQWMRQGVLIHPGPKYSLQHQGQKHSLTVHRLALSDSGRYSCETLHDRTQAQLSVQRESEGFELTLGAYAGLL